MTWTWLGILAVLFLALSCFSAYKRGFINVNFANEFH